MSTKTSYYEILSVASNASLVEIQAAHLRETQKLQAEQPSVDTESRDNKLKVLNMALQTLSNPTTRKAYDTQLNPTTELSLVPIADQQSIMSLKAEALALKADAATLKAEAAMLKADAMSRQIAVSPDDVMRNASKAGRSSGTRSTLRSILTILGGVVAVGMVLQVIGFMMVGSSAKQRADAEEKVMIQQYYQEHGVRPKNRAELEMLEAENRRNEIARRETERVEREAERAAKEKESEQRRFVEDSRRQAESVSHNLRYAEARAEQEARIEAEQKREAERLARQEKRDKEEAERRRIADERRKLGLNP